MIPAEQFKELLLVLRQIADRPYSITNASDWPMLAFMMVIIMALIGFMWRDLGSKLTSDKQENKAEHDRIWSAMRDCQDDCCPRKKQ